MLGDRGSLRSRLLGGDRPTDKRMVEALASRLDDTENVVYQLTSTGALVHEYKDETREKGGGDGGTLLAVTDRQLVVVVDTDSGIETAAVPYTDLKDVTTTSSLLRTKLAVRVWGRGTFRLTPKGGDDVDDVVTFAADASETWQRAVAALQDARQHFSSFARRVSAGDAAGSADARDGTYDNLRKAKEWAKSAADPVEAAVRERIESVEREFHSTRMTVRFERARTLARRASVLADAGEYDRAYETLTRAASDVGTALTIAIEEDFDQAREIQTERETIWDQLTALESLPLERADRALDRALAVDNRQLAAIAWQRALDRYRDALTAGWGTDANFDGDTDALRMQVEWLAAKNIRVRQQLAERHEADGDARRMAGDGDAARAHYEVACDHLQYAATLASQYRAGDARALRARDGWITGKCPE